MPPLEPFDRDAYLARIGHHGAPVPDLDTLRRLHVAHLGRIPFENIDVRLGRPVSLDLGALQLKLVAAHRGGYCFEQNTLPALKGSLAQVYKPCIRPQCAACARGDKHPNYLLTFTERGRRRCLYVPKPVVPLLKRALANGRRIEQLLYEMGPALLREYHTRNPAQTGPAARIARAALQVMGCQPDAHPAS